MRRYLLCMLLVWLHCIARGQTGYAYRYWLDDAAMVTHRDSSATGDWVMELDVSGLSEGLHQLHLQVCDTAGVWSTPQSRFFLKTTPLDTTDVAMRYWFDNGDEVMETTAASGVQSIDVSALSWGLHTVYYQIAGPNGIYSAARHGMFMKTRMSAEAYTARCYVNDSLYAEQTTANGGELIRWDFDVTSLPRGLHSLRMQVHAPEGPAVSVAHSFFWRELTVAERNATRCLYTIDGGVTMQEAPAMQDGGFRFDVDVSALDGGLHELVCMMVNEKNEVMHSSSRFFMVKRPTTMRYDYWVNDDTTRMKTVMMAEHMEPYAAIAMLDVPTYPLRSSSFHFEVDDDIPYIYAKNTLHARFYSSNGTYAEDSALYVDGGSRREVMGILPLETRKPRTDLTPEADSIRWYSLEGYADTELRFLVSQPCTVEVFSPEGTRLQKVSGEAVTDTFTCHAANDGIYYLALHSAAKADTMTTISYMRGNVKQYRVDYFVDGELFVRDTVARGDSIVPQADPVKEGHTFGGWSEIPVTMPAEDVTVTGTFTINTYKLTYMVNGKEYFADSVVYDTPLTAIAEPEKEGYTFSGWSEIPETMPAEDVMVTGEFVLNSTQTDGQGLVYEFNTEKDAFVVTGYTGDLADDVVIPLILYELPVEAVKEKALMGAEQIKSIVIPRSVRAVGERVFYGCTNLLVVEWNATAPLRAGSFDEEDYHGNLLVFVSDAATEVTYGGNVVINDRAESITLTSGKPFRNPRVFTATNICFTHDFTKKTKIGEAGGWEALVLPFDVQTVASEKKGALLPFGQADFSTSLPYWAAEMQADAAFSLVQKITANTPFIMEVPNSEEYEDAYNVEGMVTFSAADVTVHATTENQQSSGDGYSLLAAYEGISSASGVYALNDEEYTATDGSSYLPGGVFVADSRDIRPFEAYVYSESASRAPYLRIGGKEGTGIGAATVTSKDDAWYTLQGIRLSGRPQERGVYILKGKKVIIK